mmetsp:Transcript_116589/g.326157  ORF Transcript_116589/g.326157 Transcript_116589/m.326157 type:complete len:265 (-) Transcript_116589:17-811(-)
MQLYDGSDRARARARSTGLRRRMRGMDVAAPRGALTNDHLVPQPLRPWRQQRRRRLMARPRSARGATPTSWRAFSSRPRRRDDSIRSLPHRRGSGISAECRRPMSRRRAASSTRRRPGVILPSLVCSRCHMPRSGPRNWPRRSGRGRRMAAGLAHGAAAKAKSNSPSALSCGSPPRSWTTRPSAIRRPRRLGRERGGHPRRRPPHASTPARPSRSASRPRRRCPGCWCNSTSTAAPCRTRRARPVREPGGPSTRPPVRGQGWRP